MFGFFRRFRQKKATTASAELNLADLSRLRQAEYTAISNVMFERVDGASQAAYEFMNIGEQIKKGATFVWQTIGLVDDKEVIMMGLLQFPVGTTFEMPNGTKVPVTEETAYAFRQLIRVSLPVDIAEGGKQAVLDFLAEKEKQMVVPVEGEDNVLESLIKQQKEDKSGEPQFDLTQLSEEQLHQFKLLSGSKGNG